MNTVTYTEMKEFTLTVSCGDIVKIKQANGELKNYIVTVATVDEWHGNARYNLSCLETGKRWTKAMLIDYLSEYVQNNCENGRMEYIGPVEMVLKPKEERS